MINSSTTTDVRVISGLIIISRLTNTSTEPQLIIAQKSRESLQQILEIYGVYAPDLLEFLTAMLRVHPDDRLSATELQTLPWLRDE